MDLSGLTISSIGACPLNENVFVFAYRLSDETVWLWHGQELIDGDNPSLSGFSEILAANAYDEPLAVVSGAPADDNEVTGPVSYGTLLTLPLDSRDSDNSQAYVVGKGVLEVNLNGQQLTLGTDFNESGPAGSASTQFQILQNLEIGDKLDIRIKTNGGYVGVGAISTGGEVNTGSNVGGEAEVFKFKSGVDFVHRTIKAGTNISVTQNADTVEIGVTGSGYKSIHNVLNADYTILDGDGYDVFLVTTSAITRTISLPTAADNNGRTVIVKKIDSGVGFVRVNPEGGEYVDDQLSGNYLTGTNQLENQWDSVTMVCNGSDWYVI